MWRSHATSICWARDEAPDEFEVDDEDELDHPEDDDADELGDDQSLFAEVHRRR
jgi:hypothetical protein